MGAEFAAARRVDLRRAFGLAEAVRVPDNKGHDPAACEQDAVGEGDEGRWRGDAGIADRHGASRHGRAGHSAGFGAAYA